MPLSHVNILHAQPYFPYTRIYFPNGHVYFSRRHIYIPYRHRILLIKAIKVTARKNQHLAVIKRGQTRNRKEMTNINFFIISAPKINFFNV